MKKFPYRLIWMLLAVILLSACSGGSSPANTPVAGTVARPGGSPTAGPTETLTATITPASTATPTPTPVAQAGLPSIGDPYTPELGNSGYDVQHYALQFTLDPGEYYVEAQAEISLSSLLPALDRFSLDFAGFEIDALSADDLPVNYQRKGSKLWIDLPEPLFAGDTVTLNIRYHGQPLNTASEYVPFVGHLGLYFPGSTIFSLSEPDGAHFWYPCNNHPLDKATYEMDITVPDTYTAVSNGTLVAETPTGEGQTTYSWQHPYPMAPYLSVLAVGQYELLESRSPGGIPIRHYVYPDRKEEFLQASVATGEALDWMAETFGPYPFEAFGFVTSRLVSLASETQTMVVLPETSLNEETVLHEIAHMWFGDWVSLESWADMWLKEGAAIYTYLLWQTRNDPQALDFFMQERIDRLQQDPSGYALNDLPHAQLLGTDTYWRGAAVYHMLRLEIGEEAFFEGLRTIVREYGGGNMSVDEFIAVMEAASGKDLQEFFTEWVATP